MQRWRVWPVLELRRQAVVLRPGVSATQARLHCRPQVAENRHLADAGLAGGHREVAQVPLQALVTH